jgi:hypothetical protein
MQRRGDAAISAKISSTVYKPARAVCQTLNNCYAARVARARSLIPAACAGNRRSLRNDCCPIRRLIFLLDILFPTVNAFSNRRLKRGSPFRDLVANVACRRSGGGRGVRFSAAASMRKSVFPVTPHV